MNTRGWLMMGLGLILTAVGLAVALIRPMAPLKAVPVPQKDEFAQDRAPPKVTQPPFDAARAMKHLEDICAIGTRVSGSGGMDKQQKVLEKHFTEQGAKVTWQKFEGKQKSTRATTAMANLIASWHPDRPVRVIICSHYDTRPRADQETDRRKKEQPFLSANDGGSGAALLMEMARHMKDLPCELGVDFVLFDGEEWVLEPEDEYFHGSKFFASEYKKQRASGKIRYRSAILLDMIAGKEPRFPVEQNSWWSAPRLVEEVYGIAIEQGATFFEPRKFSSTPVQDDHVPLNAAGIPAIDLIDFDYPHWHKITDTPENCSPDGMKQVAGVLFTWLQRVR